MSSGEGWKDEEPPPALRPQRGGSPVAASVLYRDTVVDRLWDALCAGESIVVSAEKRVGKTAVMRVLEARATGEVAIIYRDVEGVGSPRRLAELVAQDVLPRLGGQERARHRLKAVLEKLGGTSVGPITLPDMEGPGWQAHLDELFGSLDEHLESEGRVVVLIWDEAPWMVDKVRRDCGWEVAVDLLDELRAARDRYRSIRFVFTGSIGFHHVLRSLRAGRSHRATLNTMRDEELPPLAPADAGRLAWALLRWAAERSEITPVVALPDLAERVGEVCEGIPWFVHAAVDDLTRLGGPIDLAAVDQVVADARFAPNDGWELSHYEDRLPECYGDDAVAAGLALDAVAVRGAASTEQMANDLRHHGPGPDDVSVRRLLELLQADHYLRRGPDGWSFTYRIIREAWLDRRDLRHRQDGVRP